MVTYKPSQNEIKLKESYLLKLLKYIFKILGPYKKLNYTSTLLGILRKQDLANFSDLDFLLTKNK